METPSEWAKRFNQQKTGQDAGSPNPEAATKDNTASVAEFPSEPFPCPACGQLLAPSCRVCVACKHPLDPAEIARPSEAVLSTARSSSTEARPVPIRYPWPIFFMVLGFAFLLGLLYSGAVVSGLLKENQAQLALQGAPILAGVWVFFDALRRRIPRPLRWAVGTMLLLIVIFPWYLARRRSLQSSVPFVEGEVGPVARFLLFVLLFFILASLIYTIVQGPPPANAPPSRPTIQRTGGNTASRASGGSPAESC